MNEYNLGNVFPPLIYVGGQTSIKIFFCDFNGMIIFTAAA